MQLSMKEVAEHMKMAAPKLAVTTCKQRNDALLLVKEALLREKEAVFAANHKDMEAAAEADIAPAVMKRLKFDEGKLTDVCKGIEQLVSLEDPLGKKDLSRELDEGLTLYRVSCPIGVIGIIFEARPDALVQISCLCIKSGNCAILKGGKETVNTNKVLFSIIHKAVIQARLPEYTLHQATLHNEIDELLACDREVDLLIPRGSNQFVQYIMNHTKIPVMGHADGVCHIYVDKDADMQKALSVIEDAKIQYTAACNAVETILVHRDIATAFLPLLKERLKENNVLIRGTKEVADTIGCEVMEENEFHTEYLDLIVSVKIVEDKKAAIEHINYFGSHHTDCIITENDETADVFMEMVDSAGVYRNCSTRFADGFRYGFGAEVGISTSKLHARGPVGLEGLVTYKYKLYGDGHVVSEYASGKRSFHFKNL
ncbi:MAG: glutamate-5-semialdehyde dehydrogenase [Lachnospiraceae bacterium]|nr:glutamate-5-semialdehyde dehydrogenase [Lachnospiraceae bacterium]